MWADHLMQRTWEFVQMKGSRWFRWQTRIPTSTGTGTLAHVFSLYSICECNPTLHITYWCTLFQGQLESQVYVSIIVTLCSGWCHLPLSWNFEVWWNVCYKKPNDLFLTIVHTICFISSSFSLLWKNWLSFDIIMIWVEENKQLWWKILNVWDTYQKMMMMEGLILN